MLSKTTSLLPEGLFASLGVTRGVESDMRGVKLVSSLYAVNHHPNFDITHFTNVRISTIASEKLVRMLSRPVRTRSVTHSKNGLQVWTSTPIHSSRRYRCHLLRPFLLPQQLLRHLASKPSKTKPQPYTSSSSRLSSVICALG